MSNDDIIARIPTLSDQHPLFRVEKHAEINGIEMGVLENGIPYLTERGLARMCGIDSAGLNRLAANWPEERKKTRGKEIVSLLDQSDYPADSLFLKSDHNGVQINAYTEPVCLALLEYYAFIADKPREDAKKHFRALARFTFRRFIYEAVGYAPERSRIDGWQHFHDRIDMTAEAVPIGYFSIFREIASMIVPMIRSGVMISDKVVPDISVGQTLSAYWESNKLTEKYGERTRYSHSYPEYYPQAQSNPQQAYAYPETALPEFREWLRNEYIASKFPRYLMSQARMEKISKTTANKALEVFSSKAIKQ